jgi:hypothetical protein
VRAARDARRTPGGPWHILLNRVLAENTLPEPFPRGELESIARGNTPASPAALSTILTALLAVRAIQHGAAAASAMRRET